MTRKLFIGVDGGASKTAAVVVDEKLKTLGEGRAGPSNHLRIGLEQAFKNISFAVREAVMHAKARLEDIEYAFLGIAGADHPKHRQQLIDALRELFTEGNFTVDNDARIALTGAIGTGAGIVVIAGTGSVAFGRNDANREARAGGWGPTLGDEGSGYSIARRGLAAVLRDADGRGPSTAISHLICSHYGMCRPEDLPLFVYAPDVHVDDIAVCFQYVIEAADQNDAVALKIFNEEGDELGRTVAAVAKRLDLTESEFAVGCVGGAFNAGEYLMGPLRKAILEVAPHARLQRPNATPVLGAAQMAIRNAGEPRPDRKKQ